MSGGAPSPQSGRRPLSRARLLVFSVVATLGILFAANTVIEWLSDRGALETEPGREPVQAVDGELFVQDGDGNWRTTAHAEESMPAAQFGGDKGESWRAFVLGGSFAQGVPYTNQNSPGSGGGIPSFLEAELTRRSAGRPIELINAAAGGQDSSRVLEIGKRVLELSPDLLIVATCNNEGTPGPGRLGSYLQDQGGFRLLQKLIGATEEPTRSWYTPQDPDTERVRQSFQSNLQTLLDLAGQAGVPVLLATLPVNLRYGGFDPGHVTDNDDGEDQGDIQPEDPAAALDARNSTPETHIEVFDKLPCRAGISLFEAEEFEAALPLLRRCLRMPSERISEAPFITTYVALAELELGRDALEASGVRLEARWGPCLAQGILHYYGGRYDAAIESLEQCDNVAEALRWIGRSHLALGQPDRARELLTQSVELRPSNRCRPSFNELIRQEAAAREHVRLVDLDDQVSRQAGERLTGAEEFLDYCHMNWKAQRSLGESLLAAIEQLDPELLRPTEGSFDEEAFAERYALPRGGNVDQVQTALERTGKGRHALGLRGPGP